MLRCVPLYGCGITRPSGVCWHYILSSCVACLSVGWASALGSAVKRGIFLPPLYRSQRPCRMLQGVEAGPGGPLGARRDV